jgi:hypothetical protein
MRGLYGLSGSRDASGGSTRWGYLPLEVLNGGSGAGAFSKISNSETTHFQCFVYYPQRKNNYLTSCPVSCHCNFPHVQYGCPSWGGGRDGQSPTLITLGRTYSTPMQPGDRYAVNGRTESGEALRAHI